MDSDEPLVLVFEHEETGEVLGRVELEGERKDKFLYIAEVLHNGDIEETVHFAIKRWLSENCD